MHPSGKWCANAGANHMEKNHEINPFAVIQYAGPDALPVCATPGLAVCALLPIFSYAIYIN